MPIPKPNTGETRQNFLDRCMADNTMTGEFSEQQRFAVCSSQWDNRNKAMDPCEYKSSSLWRRMDRQRGSFRAKYRKLFARKLEDMAAPFFDMLDNIGIIENAGDKDFDVPTEGIEDAYRNMYLETGKGFARKEYQAFAKQTEERDLLEDTWTLEILNYMENNVLGSNIKLVQGTTKDFLRRKVTDVLAVAKAEGWGTSMSQIELKDRIIADTKDFWKGTIRYRTERIVRTESTTASEVGRLAAANTTGRPYQKIWVAAADERSRNSHIEVHLQRRKNNEMFDVGGEVMEHPGDQRASAANVINCRCSLSINYY